MRFYNLNNKIPHVIPDSIYIYNDRNEMDVFYFNYLQHVYGNKFARFDNNILYHIDPNAINKFYEDGGIFTKEEMSNIKFSRLYDDNFILNIE